MEKPFVYLDPGGIGDLGLLLLVERPTGVFYGTQAGGYACEQTEMEGFLVPLGCRQIEDELYAFFDQEFDGHCYEPKNDWTAGRILRLEAIVSRIPIWFTSRDGEEQPGFLTVDTTRIKQCIEAWIPVVSPYGKGILTLGNSD